MPDVSPQSIFFPYDEEQGRYRASFYDEGMTYNQVSKQEINSFVSGLNRSSPNFAEFKTFPKFVYFYLGFGLLSLIIGCIMIFCGRYYTISRGLTLFGLFFVVGGMWSMFKGVTKFIDNQDELLQQTKCQINEYCDKNSEPFKNKHLMWKVPEDHFDWIELTLVPSMKSKSLFSEKETALSIGDMSTFRNGSTAVDNNNNAKGPFLTNLI